MSKTRMGKRVASLLLSLVMMLSLLPTTVYATEDTGGGTGATYDAVQQTESGDNTENTGKLESTGEGEDDSEAGNEGETSVTYVAQVGDVQYKTLEEAIGVAADGATVSLLDNVTLNTTLTVAKSITIDVGGFTLTVATDGDGIVVNNATLTLTGTGKYVFNCTASGSDGIFVNNTVEGGTSELNLNGNVDINVSGNVSSAIHAYASAGKAVVNINAGTITARGSKQFPGVVVDQNATLNMTGGTFDLSMDFDAYSDGNDVVGVLIWGGSSHKQENCAVNISGGTFKVGGKNAFAQAVQVGMSNGYSENCTVNISGGNVVLNPTEGGKGYVYTAYKASYATAAITGGTVSGKVTAIANTYIRDLENDGLTISGGTFSGITVDEKYLAEGKTLNESGNVVDKAPEVKPVTVNGVGYDTLEAAIAAAQDGDTVTLLADVDENVEIAAGKNLTLDLNGCTLNGGTGTNKAALTNYGTITITDSSEDKTGTIKRDDIGTVGETSYYVILNQGTMTIESGTVINNSGYKKANSTGSMVGSSLICNGDCNGGSTLTINGGTFTQYNFIAIKNGALGVLYVTGGTITSNHSAIQNWFEADITGGEINGQLWTDAYTAGVSDGKTKIGGNATFTGEIVMDIYGNSVAPTLEITSGKLDVTNWKITDAAANVGAKPAISGGTFKAAVPADYLADGFEIKQNSDGSYGVEKAASYVAKIGEQEYATLQAAFDAAKTGDTVTLLADTTEDVEINKNITLDLGGKTLTNTNAGKATISVTGGTVTVKSGNVMGGTSYYNIEVTKGSNANLTLEDVTATAGNNDSSMIDNFGTLTIKSGDYSGGLNVVKSEEGSTLTINGGKFTLEYATEGYTGVVFAYGDTTISGGEFIQNLTTTGRWNHPTVILTGVVEGYTAITRVTGGHFVNKMSGESIFRGVGKGTSDNFEVSGGTFNKSVPDSFFKEGYFAQKNTDSTYGVGGPAVAKVNSAEGYNTLAEAIAAAKAGETVTLLQNVTVDKPIIVGKAITLDLGGKTLTSTWAMPSDASGADRYALVNNAKMTLTNGTFAAGEARAIGAYAGLTLNNVTVSQTLTGGHACVAFCKDGATYTIKDSTINGAYAVANFANNATIKITGSELNGSGCGLYHNGSNYGLELTVRATTINGSLDGAIGNENDPSGVYISGSTATVEKGGMQFASFTNCTIKGATAIEVKYTNLKLDKCTVEATAKTPSYSKNNNGMTALGFAVVSTDNSKDGVTPVPAGTVTITGKGNYTGLVGLGALKSVKETYKDFADGTIEVSGGTFSSAVMPEYCADGFVPTQNDNGTYGVREANYVAQVGSTKYESLAEAIKAAKSKDTVKLLADTRENVTIDKAMTLDLNGHTLNGGTEKGKPALTITARTVTIKDSSEAQTGTIMREDTAENSGVSSHYVIDIQGNAWVMFESGTVKNDSGAGGTKGASLVRVGDDSVANYPGLNIKGGTFTQDNFIVIKVDSGDLFLNGGTLNSAHSYAIEDWHRATIKGGTVNGAVAAWTYSGGQNSDLSISGGTVNGDVTSVNYGSTEGKVAKVSITGGTVNGELDTRSYDPKTNELTSIDDAAKATIKVTGGTFDRDPGKYVVEDSAVNQNADGTFGVEKAYLAKVGETSYYTMDEAFEAQTASGEPIVMLRDYTTGSPFRSGSINRTVDLNGHTWTCTGTDANSAAFEINNSNVTLTVKSGKVVSSQLVGLIPSAMGGTITYDNSGLVFESVEMKTTAHSGIETNGNNTNDTVTLKDSTLNVPNGFGIYFPSSGTLTIDNSTITAKTMGVQVCSGSLNINDGSEITVTGDPVEKTENDGAIQDGAAISIVNRTGYKGLDKIKVTGGTFTAKTGNDAIKAYDWANNTATDFTANDKVFVSGGTFSSIPDNMTELCAKDYIPELTPSGAYEVRKADYVAAISDKQYTSLANAIAAAKDGDTVKLLDDVVLDKTLIIKDKTITLDLNGKTISNSVDIWNENTYAWSLISVRDKGNLTIDDTTGGGTLKAKENDCFALDVYAYDTKNVENTKLTINAGNYVGNISAVYAFTGKATINGGHFSIQQKESGSDPYRLTLNCYDSSYTAGRAHITVTGGTFVGFDPANNKAEGEGTSFVPEGYIPKDNGDGSYTVVKGTYVAEYNGKKYTSLQEAINAASQKNGGQAVVTLLGNLTITETVNFAKQYAGSVLLNLGGYTLTGENCRALQINKGNLYLENGTVTSTGIADSKSVIRIGSDDTTYSGSNPMLYMRNGAKVLAPVSYGVTIFGSATVSETLTVAGNASIEATGPSPAISGQGGQAYHVDGKGTKVIITGNAVVSATNNYAIYHPDNGTLDIQGGTITGKGGIQMCSGTLNISGSPKIEALGKANHETGAAGPIYDIAAISVVNRSYPGGAPVVTIKGTPTITTVDGEVIHAYTWSSNAESEWADAGKNINVSGGTYSKTFNEAYLAADCTLVANNDTTYTVKQEPVAVYNGTQYTSLPQALKDARNAGGGEVKLLKDVTQTTSSLDIGKVTLNLNRQTLTLDGGAQLYTSGDATINNGTIKRIDTPTSGSANSFAIQVMSGSSLVLGTTSDDTVAIESTYGVYNAGGTLTVSHATITTDGWSVAVNDSKTKTGEVTIGEGAVITSQNGNCISTMVNSKPNVTITGGQLTSNGTNWDAGVIYWASEGTLTITGGTFTASSDEGSTAAAVHQKNGTVKISGTTAKLLGNNALVVQAGDGSTGTMVTELSGGTYSTKPDDSWVVDGYRAIGNTDGSFTVVEGKFTVQVTSRTVSSESPVANVSGGGSNITYAEGTTVTAASLSGYTFKGWYLEKYTDDNSTLVKTDLSFTYHPTADCKLIAVYEPISGGVFALKVYASKFTINGGAVRTGVVIRKESIGTTVTVEFKGNDGENFLYWVNESNKVVSTSKTYTFIMGSETTLSAVYGAKQETQAMVVFVSHTQQVISSEAYTSTQDIEFPEPPIKMGATFLRWSMTQDQIHAAMETTETGIITVEPVYESTTDTYTVTINYPDKTTDTITKVIGEAAELKAAEIENLTFKCWMNGSVVLGYTPRLTVAPRSDLNLTAVYVENGTKVDRRPVITLTEISASQQGPKYAVSFSATRSVPDEYIVTEQGVLVSTDSRYGEKDALKTFKLDADGARPAGTSILKGTNLDATGVTILNGLTKFADRTVYGRAYMILQNKVTNENVYIYSDTILSGSYDSLTKANGGN